MEFQSDPVEKSETDIESLGRVEKKVEEEFYDQALNIAKEMHQKQHKTDDFDVELVKGKDISESMEEPVKEVKPVHDSDDKMYGQKFAIEGTFRCSCGWKKPVHELLQEAQETGYTLKGYKAESDGHVSVDANPGYAANKQKNNPEKSYGDKEYS